MNTIEVLQLGQISYSPIYDRQRQFTDTRTPETADQIWCLEHTPVYTLGLAGRYEHILNPGNVEVVQTDRGGQVTYHGPGQLVIYLLLDLKRLRISVKHYVYSLEQALLDMLSGLGVEAQRKTGAPGIYVEDKKLAALGVRIRRGCCYHGIALNVDMDLTPFQGINPCGYAGMEVTQLADLGCTIDVTSAGSLLIPHLIRVLGQDDHAPMVTAQLEGRTIQRKHMSTGSI